VVFANSSNSVVSFYCSVAGFSQQLLWCTTNVSHRHYKVVMQKRFTYYLAPKWKRVSSEVSSFAMAEKDTLKAGFLVIHSKSLHICLDLTFNRCLLHNSVCKQVCCHPGLENAKPLKPAYITDIIRLISD